MIRVLLAAAVLIAQLVPAPALFASSGATRPQPCLPPMLADTWQVKLPAA